MLDIWVCLFKKLLWCYMTLKSSLWRWIWDVQIPKLSFPFVRFVRKKKTDSGINVVIYPLKSLFIAPKIFSGNTPPENSNVTGLEPAPYLKMYFPIEHGDFPDSHVRFQECMDLELRDDMQTKKN